jgi:hypothetical protein
MGFAFVCLLCWATPSAIAQQKADQSPSAAPFQITDNSFLVEEAFNQEAKIFQNIFNGVHGGDEWAFAFTQEWPLVTQTHQLSYTLAWARTESHNELGVTLINYRWQALMEGPGRPAFSPRLSVILPTASGSSPDQSSGLQINLPFSKQTGDVYWHWNAGLTWLPSAGDGEEKRSLESPFFAGSAIVRLLPMLNAMLESVVLLQEEPLPTGTTRDKSFTLSPGVRGGWNLGDTQLILGFAVPVTWNGGDRDTAAFFYLSYELPFKK